MNSATHSGELNLPSRWSRRNRSLAGRTAAGVDRIEDLHVGVDDARGEGVSATSPASRSSRATTAVNMSTAAFDAQYGAHPT